MRSNIVEVIIGAIVLIVAGVFLNFAYRSGTTTGNHGYTLTAKFDRIDGLVLGNDVKVSGVKVGTVKEITIDPTTYMAVVKVSVQNDIYLPNDTIAEIVSESFMGGKYVALVPGGADDNLKPGDTISFTQSAVSLESLIGKFIFSKSDDKEESGQSHQGKKEEEK
ncbi:MAG TPA: outer membrane lipid asymmetry maintenance protein MlaD [Candidatus Nitrosotenuis sp.]|nr:outer membrane lipid asymmetry maintenance protein MlaD [Candidatus Nitrosotenuis sp.]